MQQSQKQGSLKAFHAFFCLQQLKNCLQTQRLILYKIFQKVKRKYQLNTIVKTKPIPEPKIGRIEDESSPFYVPNRY